MRFRNARGLSVALTTAVGTVLVVTPASAAPDAAVLRRPRPSTPSTPRRSRR